MKKITKIATSTLLGMSVVLGSLTGVLVTNNNYQSNNQQSTQASPVANALAAIQKTSLAAIWKVNDLSKSSFIEAFLLDKANENRITNMESIFSTYIDGRDLVANADYHLLGGATNGFEYNEISGDIIFTIWPSKYYNAEGVITNGSVSDKRSHFKIEALIWRTPSKYAVAANYPKNIKPKDFVAYITSGNKTVVDQTKAANYFESAAIDLERPIIIRNAKFGAPDVNGIVNTIIFDLQFGSWNISHTSAELFHDELDYVLTLADQPAPFRFNSANKPTDTNPNLFIDVMIEDGMELVAGQTSTYKLSDANHKWLSRFGSFNSKIENSTWWLEVLEKNSINGILTINLSTNVWYNASGGTTGEVGGPLSPGSAFSLTTQLANATHIPPKTEITTKMGSPSVVNADSFIRSLKNSDGSWSLTEIAKYVDGLHSIPTSASIKDIVLKNEADGKYEFEIKITGWWNGDTQSVQPEKTFTFVTGMSAASAVSAETNGFQWWWILIGVGAVGTIGGFGWWYFKFKKNGMHKTAETSKT